METGAARTAPAFRYATAILKSTEKIDDPA
jgi:hypothetical protein